MDGAPKSAVLWAAVSFPNRPHGLMVAFGLTIPGILIFIISVGVWLWRWIGRRGGAQ